MVLFLIRKYTCPYNADKNTQGYDNFIILFYTKLNLNHVVAFVSIPVNEILEQYLKPLLTQDNDTILYSWMILVNCFMYKNCALVGDSISDYKLEQTEYCLCKKIREY